MRGRTSRFRLPDEDTSKMPSNDYVVKRITAAFKITNKEGIAFGLRPFSSVNYLYLNDQMILDGNTAYSKIVNGNGGINQVYFSYGYAISKYVSAGITASYLFGSLQRETSYLNSSINLDIQRNELDFYTGGQFQGGLQVRSKEGGSWQHTGGFTVAGGTNLRGERTSEYVENGVAINKEIEREREFRLPVSFGLGYTATHNSAFSYSIEANYYNWPYQKVAYSRSYTNPAMRVSAGWEYSKKIKRGNSYAETYYLGLGATVENGYLRIKDNYLVDVSVSAGGGINLMRGLSLYSGIEFGRRGNKNYDQAQESYTQFILGVTLKDIWIGPKYLRRFGD